MFRGIHGVYLFLQIERRGSLSQLQRSDIFLRLILKLIDPLRSPSGTNDHHTCSQGIQCPPVFSACKIEGKRAYELARKGEEVELKSKTLVIDELELLECDLPVIKIRVVCSKGTYIRALARDIGKALDSGAHLIGLERTRIGEVTLDMCMSPEEIDDFLEQNVVKIEEEK